LRKEVYEWIHESLPADVPNDCRYYVNSLNLAAGGEDWREWLRQTWSKTLQRKVKTAADVFREVQEQYPDMSEKDKEKVYDKKCKAANIRAGSRRNYYDVKKKCISAEVQGADETGDMTAPTDCTPALLHSPEPTPEPRTDCTPALLHSEPTEENCKSAKVHEADEGAGPEPASPPAMQAAAKASSPAPPDTGESSEPPPVKIETEQQPGEISEQPQEAECHEDEVLARMAADVAKAYRGSGVSRPAVQRTWRQAVKDKTGKVRRGPGSSFKSFLNLAAALGYIDLGESDFDDCL
jgi:hypothetical protein